MSSPDREPILATISELKPQMKHLTVSFKVIEKSEVREVTSRKDGEQHRVLDARVGDSTGTVLMPLWDDAIEEIEIDKSYTLENGYTGLFRGNLRLNKGRYGEIKEADEEITEVDMSVDMSEAEHEDTRRRRSYGGRGGRGDRRGGRGGRRDYGYSRDRRDSGRSY